MERDTGENWEMETGKEIKYRGLQYSVYTHFHLSTINTIEIELYQ